ncbi:MAG TPA: glycosyltransferase family 2 protein [Hypericibacter adhaerens]|jgi:glycosyltransferase involved in cell wall biosynthesis|uniref:Glycosyl transferase n=1 Tax=Hypericibacter adhaerens TaxID=2602016 RepID=A0A5J6N6M3_9PROT|nr:glycosyltransferase family 2 protein [Hypericibacter adhaerens]QEX24300.1 glycosyl transferase [Hypericibacter adhaerens]HWA43540.1 glycosyltransferase family 2 protein [Hypericibacter adhaerens]
MSSSTTVPVNLAVVVPFFNEGLGAAAFLDRLRRALEAIERSGPGKIDWRVICVNDGSRDDTLKALLQARRVEPRIAVIDLSRNFGKEYALTAGLDHADADVVIAMDGDGQHPPEMMGAMLEAWRQGNDVVYMVREARDVRGLHRLLRNLFYGLFALASRTKLPPEAGDFRLMDRHVVAAIRQMPERTRFLKGIYSWVGFRQTGLKYREDARMEGRSRWCLSRLLSFAMDGLSAFSTLPLRIWSWIGAAVAGLSLLYGAWRVIRAIFWGIDVPGFETIVVSITFLGGMQLLSLGVLGSYIGRIFEEVKARPLYIVRRSYGLSEPANETGRGGDREDALGQSSPLLFKGRS